MTDDRLGRRGASATAIGVLAAAAAFVIAAPSAAGELFSGDLRYYGQVNKAFLVHDDGDATLFYPLVDSGATSTRVGLWYETSFGDGLAFSANLEGEWTPYSNGVVNRQNREVDWDATALRKAEAILESETLGVLRIGQGSMASDGTAEADLSGTGLVAYSSIGDSAGGQLLFVDGVGPSDVSIASAFQNLDGLGRLLRIRYDTPEFHGASLRASVGRDARGGEEDAEWDVAAVYGDTLGGVRLSGAVGLAWPGGERRRLSGSISALHEDTGVSLTLAGAIDGEDGGDRSYGYGKLAWRGDVLAAGETAVSVDLYLGENIATDESESFSVGLGLVQAAPEISTDFYATLRWYDHDGAADYETATTFLIGARFSF